MRKHVLGKVYINLLMVIAKDTDIENCPRRNLKGIHELEGINDNIGI